MKKERFSLQTLDCLGKFLAENLTVKIEVRNPSPEEKTQLIAETGKDASQISQWFARQKRKLNGDKVKQWCLHEIGYTMQGTMPPPATVSNNNHVGKKRRKTSGKSHSSQQLVAQNRSRNNSMPDNGPFDHLQLRVLRNARLNNIVPSEQAMKVITTCARLSQQRLETWWSKFPKSKLSPELRQESEQHLIKNAVQFLGAEVSQNSRVIWILQNCFEAIGSDSKRVKEVIQFQLQSQQALRGLTGETSGNFNSMY